MDREKALAIMRDSRVGAYGAIGVALLLILKCAALSGMTTSAAVAALLFAHPLSRLAALALVWRLDYAREEGKAKPLAQKLSALELGIAALTVGLVALCFVTAGWMTWQALLAAFVAIVCATCWLARKFDQRLGGYTGDCLGAVQQVGEVVVYLALLAVAV
jgi:adenosylcobinamide-GDP ribazoletransferase